MLKANRVEPGSSQTNRSLKERNPCVLCTCNRQCYITLITGCYTCEWQVKQEKMSRPGPCCCSWRERLFYPLVIISFFFSVILLFVWIETSNEYFGFDWVVFLGTGYWFFWSIVLLSLFGILAAYSSLLVVLAFLLVWEGYELYLHWCHKIVILIVIMICSFFLWILCKFWRDRWLTAGLSLQVFAPYIHLSSITVMVILSWPVAFYLIHLEEEALQVAIGLPFFFILLCLYVVPLGIHSPCIQEEGKLGPKPDFFGHRGAPMVGLNMLGPENTMMAFEKAVEQGAYGLESDVHLSYDLVPFLMHDSDLRRTTNIREVMPNASFTHSSLFTWSFLSTLNAGKWFVRSRFKPFYKMKRLSKADREKAENQTIPRLTDLLKLAQKEQKFVIFDLNGPTQKHPLRNTYVRHVVSVILASKIEQHLIFWLSSFDRQYVRNAAPGFQQVGRLFSIERLTKENISIINVDYKRLFYSGLRDYKAANITINLYIVNEPWLYSLAWCSRIHSVTTDNIQILRQINHPYFFMTPGYYMFMWLFMDSVSAVLIVTIFYFHWWRERKKEMFDNASIYTDPKSISLQKREQGSQGSSNVSTKAPFRVMESPWTLAALYPTLTKNTKKHPGTRHFLVVPKKKASEPEQAKKTIKPLMPQKDAVRQLASTEKSFEPTWDATRKATFQTALPSPKMNKPIISSLEILESETEPEHTSSSEPSQESSLIMFSTTSSIFSSGLLSKKN